MKVFGSISRLVSILFRKDSQDITLRPNQGTTYTAARDMQLPPGDAAHVLVSASSTQTLTNKTIDGDDNTLQDIAIASLKTVLADADKVILRDGSGAVVSAKIVDANVDAAAAIDASKLADGSVSNTEFQYLNGVTSAIQTQLDGKQPLDSDLTALAGLAGTGLLVRTGSGTAATRTLVAGTNISITNADGVSGDITINSTASIQSFQADWATGDGTTKAITHNLGTKDVQVEIYDKTDDQTIWVDTVIRTSTNVVTLTSSEAPGAAGWRVVIHAT